MSDAKDSASPEFLKAQKKTTGAYLRFSVGLGLLSGLLLIAQAWCLANIINNVIFEKATVANLNSYFVALFFVYLFRAVLNWASEYTAVEAALRVKRDLRKKLHDRLFEVGPLSLNNERSGELINTVVDGVDALENYYARYLPTMSLVALIPLSILVFIFPIDWISGVIMLVTAPLIPFFMIMIGKGTERLNKKQWRKLARMSAHFLDMIQGLTTLKLFNASRRESQLIARISDDYRKSTMSVLRVAFLSSLLLEFLSTVSIAMVAVLIGFRLMYGELDFFYGFFALLLAPEFYQPLRNMGTHYHARMEAIGAAEKMIEILHPDDVESEDGLVKSALIKGVLNNDAKILVSSKSSNLSQNNKLGITDSIEIEFKDVSFEYEPGRPALEHLSLNIHPNENIAIVGSSGAGKSTLMNLLLAFISPQQGEIVINQKPLRQDHLNEWRHNIAWMPQRAHLFQGTIRENICLANPSANDSAMKNAAKSALIDEYIESLPDSYDTHIGERGAGLSGGQIQRIALARAFLKDAPLLLLDEPTAHLDQESELLIQQSLQLLSKNRCVISIAHRLNTVQQADRVVLLEKGRVVAIANHQTLMTENPLYQKMVDLFEQGDQHHA
ncbi:thiol reductant ABC exporter subunit CydD [Cocleimonas sp. KMM 6892]|uniref:thiol reductant ABC exporter subunit CydD n=1 Tax=unclassified Cocleimonas TaxID=2639732 RepID=UPI002DB7C0A5|nr:MULTISPECIES: thiol reductant ABC exporter subunit CydD [unclassified Cocleimonas]MEB8433995.1 thiol reductant ABC exporter subunit CydD [Cocleimonas sp. KMM 6892]MEC4716806.1 thiol reductant ABC exporter subunit CydD [Cocleimonas sp. KMM 6895]MEC4746039.1 thiol reductant ABC exporter subunit CydD [Cocleimonas sp. KMM 6896]